LTPEDVIRDGKNPDSGSGMNIPDLISERNNFWVKKKYLNTLMQIQYRDLLDPWSGIEKSGFWVSVL
jgi:hypothetical protein